MVEAVEELEVEAAEEIEVEAVALEAADVDLVDVEEAEVESEIEALEVEAVADEIEAVEIDAAELEDAEILDVEELEVEELGVEELTLAELEVEVDQADDEDVVLLAEVFQGDESLAEPLDLDDVGVTVVVEELEDEALAAAAPPLPTDAVTGAAAAIVTSAAQPVPEILVPDAVVPAPVVAAKERKSGSGGLWLWGMLPLLLAVGAGVFLYSQNQGPAKKTSDEAVAETPAAIETTKPVAVAAAPPEVVSAPVVQPRVAPEPVVAKPVAETSGGDSGAAQPGQDGLEQGGGDGAGGETAGLAGTLPEEPAVEEVPELPPVELRLAEAEVALHADGIELEAPVIAAEAPAAEAPAAEAPAAEAPAAEAPAAEAPAAEAPAAEAPAAEAPKAPAPGESVPATAPGPDPTLHPKHYKCPRGMSKVYKRKKVKVPGQGKQTHYTVWCIDRREYPGSGKPKTSVSLAGAKSACKYRGKRLCSGKEWRGGCGGKYPYGRHYDSIMCNTMSLAGEERRVAPSGYYSRCRSGWGTYDMVGNVGEWTADGRVRGGDSYRTAETATCSYSRKRAPGSTSHLVGFRCCADAVLKAPAGATDGDTKK